MAHRSSPSISLLVTTLGLISVTNVYGQYSGDVCSTLLPRAGGGALPSPNTNPFQAVVPGQTPGNLQYTPGSQVQVLITSALGDSPSYQSILAQASADGSSRPIGTFSSATDFIRLDCGPDGDDTILSADSTMKTLSTTLLLNWQPPPRQVGIVFLKIIIYVRPGVFWWIVLVLNPAPGLPRLCENNGVVVGDGCQCPSPYDGPSCRDCSSNPCENNECPFGSYCTPHRSLCNRYNCNAADGTTCSACCDNPCSNDGTCTAAPNNPRGYMCACGTGFSGEKCRIFLAPVINPFGSTVIDLQGTQFAVLRDHVLRFRIDYIVFRVTQAITITRVEVENSARFRLGVGEVPLQDTRLARRPISTTTLQIVITQNFWVCVKAINSNFRLRIFYFVGTVG